MIRMEVTCFLVVAFMSIIYFSARREKTRIHKVFSIFLIMTMLHLVFDGITIYTVNHLETVPRLVNDLLHRLFIATMLVVFYLIYHYIALLIEEESKEELELSIFSTVMLVIAMIGAFVLPVFYKETVNGNYSYGPAAYMLYICVGVYLLLAAIIMCKYWKQIYVKKKMAIGVAMLIELVVSVYQAVRPIALCSGMAIMLIALAFYLTMENPDILLVQQVQREKKKADEANAAKSAFLSHMSHEIRTPMNSIVGMTQIMLRTELTTEQREYLDNIKSSGNALLAIINDILDISKIEAGKMELVEDIYESRVILNDVRMIIRNQIGDKPVELVYDIDTELPRCMYGDALRIRQILINLLNNAVKFTDEGKVKLTVKVQKREADDIELFVSVADTGQGIEEEQLQKLFGAFEQAAMHKNHNKEGTGLGLAICSRLVQMMGGKLEVQSEYGTGSEFFFTVYQKRVEQDVEEQEADEDKVLNFTAPDAKVLVVDDNEMNLKVAVGLLSPLQMQMDVADGAKKALEMIADKKYEIIFMDHMMPVMDGVEATKLLRQSENAYCREVPIIALTANVMKEAEILFKEAGMNGVVAKPIDMRQISKVLRKWLPKDLVIRSNAEATAPEGNGGAVQKVSELSKEYNIEGIDATEGIRNSGSEKLFVSLLGDFYKLIDMKANKIEKCIQDGMVKDYTIEVHALKNTARMIGAMELSEQFLHLEQLGNEGALEEIKEKTPEVLTHYRSYKVVLKQFGDKQGLEKRDADVPELKMYVSQIRDAIDGFDLDAADVAMENLEACRLPEACRELFEELRVYIADVAMENILEVTDKMLMKLEEE